MVDTLEVDTTVADITEVDTTAGKQQFTAVINELCKNFYFEIMLATDIMTIIITIIITTITTNFTKCNWI